MCHLLCVQVFLCCLGLVHSFCPSMCTCMYHGGSDGTGTRSVLCNDPDMSDIPTDIPADTVKLRLEKTAVRRIPMAAFHYLPGLRYLWVAYCAVATLDPGALRNMRMLHELRLDGNQLATFPWEALWETPRLRTLDLHNNRLASVPTDAAPLLLGLTYLDLSSNRLTTLPPDLVDIWPPFSGMLKASNSSQKLVLGLQDNPWFCDCRISKLLELSRMAETPLVLLDPSLSCSGPENLAGVPFQLAELNQCRKPSVATSVNRVTSPLGSNVLLRCDATGYPTPTLVWSKASGPPLNNTVQESPGEGIRWSIISLNGILYKDAGEYRCRAKNLAGISEASISLVVVGVITTTLSPQMFSESRAASQAWIDSVLVTSPATTPPFTTTNIAPTIPLGPAKKKAMSARGQQRARSQKEKLKKGQQASMKPNDRGKNVENATVSAGQKLAIRNIQAAEEAPESVVLLWKADGGQGSIPLSIVYSPHGEKEKRTATVEAGRGRLLLVDLKPQTKYMACLIAGSLPKKSQCVTFTTAEPGVEDRLVWVLMIAGSLACALALPLVAVLLCKACFLCRATGDPGGGGSNDLSKDTYVNFEMLSLKQRTLGSELWIRRLTQESERMLLCSRNSFDSELTLRSESSRSEYVC